MLYRIQVGGNTSLQRSDNQINLDQWLWNIKGQARKEIESGWGLKRCKLKIRVSRIRCLELIIGVEALYRNAPVNTLHMYRHKCIKYRANSTVSMRSKIQ